MAKTANVSAQLTVHDEVAGSLASPSVDMAINFSLALAAGVGAGQFDIAYFAEREVASGANDDIDLAGVLTDAFDDTFTAAEVVAIMIVNRKKSGAANTTALTLGGGSNPVVGFASAVLDPGAMILSASPDASGLFVVTAGTGDILRIANGSGALNNYLIGILARSTA